MKRRPTLSTPRAVAIYREMLDVRRELFDDNEFFKVPDAWEAICEGSEKWKTKTYRTEQLEDYKRKAGIIVFEEYVTLSVDERLIENARKGCKLSNFILAHEIGHLALDHHANNAKMQNYQLFAGPNGMSNIPPTQEELEANFAGVFFQCGVALENKQVSTIQLAHRAFSDVRTVGKAQNYVQLEVFQRELRRPRPKYERVVL